MTRLWAWLLDRMVGPRCGMDGCTYRARGPRSLIRHLWTHLDDVEAPL